MKNLAHFVILCAFFWALIGCSSMNSPITPSTPNSNALMQTEGNPFADYPVDKPYGEYTINGNSFSIDSAGGFQRAASIIGLTIHNVVPNSAGVKFDKAGSTGSMEFAVYNDGEIIYDAHLVLDEILPLGSEAVDIDGSTRDGKPFWNFGIIPGGKTSPTRKLEIRYSSSSGISVKGHVEFKERAYIQWGNVMLHTDGFDGNDIKPNYNFGEIVSNEIIAGLPTGRSISEVYDYLISKNLMPVGCDSALNSLELRIIDGRTPEEVEKELEFDLYLKNPELNPILSIDYFPTDPIYDPNKTDDNRWAFDRINAIAGWDYYSDSSVNDSGNANVAWGTILAILDTGMIKHEDFNLSSTDIWIMDNIGKNLINTSQKPIDDNGHGTSVAGIAGAKGGNSKGMAGMAWDPIFVPVKVLNADGKSSGYSIELGLVHVRNLAYQNQWTRVVVNMSFGGYYEIAPYLYLGMALDYVNAVPNTLLVAAAGNDGAEIADKTYPAAYDACISVGASSSLQEDGIDIEVNTDETGYWGTNWGSTVDLCAPGISIYTTDYQTSSSYRSDFGGTSAATPFVSGAAALVWSKNYAYSKTQVRSAIINKCRPMQTHGKALGSGRIDLYKIFSPTGCSPTWINYNISKDTTWCPNGSPYVIRPTSFFINSGKNLLINPGTVVKMRRSLEFIILGSLTAIGSTDSKIYFTSIRDDFVDGCDVENDGNTNPYRGDWGDICFLDESSDSKCIIKYCDIQYGGGYYHGYNIIYISNASPIISFCNIQFSPGNGIRVLGSGDLGSSPLIEENSISNCSYNGIECSSNTSGSITIKGNYISLCNGGIQSGPAITHINSNIVVECGTGIDIGAKCSEFTNNSISHCTNWPIMQDIASNVELAGHGNNIFENQYKGRRIYDSSSTWPTTQRVLTYSEHSFLPFACNSSINIPSGKTLRIEQGVIIKMTGGNITVNGTLIADGDSGNRISFTSIRDDTIDGIDITGDGSTSPSNGDWGYINFADTSSDPSCLLDYCYIAYGGSSMGNIYCLDASPTISNSEICYSKTYGINRQGSSNPVLLGNTYHDNTSGDLYP